MPEEIEYANGFICGRLIGIDESSGEDEIVAGRYIRFRCSEVVVYAASAPGIVEIEMRSYDDVFQLVGTLDQIDRCMQKERLIGVSGAG